MHTQRTTTTRTYPQNTPLLDLEFDFVELKNALAEILNEADADAPEQDTIYLK